MKKARAVWPQRVALPEQRSAHIPPAGIDPREGAAVSVPSFALDLYSARPQEPSKVLLRAQTTY